MAVVDATGVVVSDKGMAVVDATGDVVSGNGMVEVEVDLESVVFVVVSKGGGVLQIPHESRQISSMFPAPHLPLSAFFQQKLVLFSLEHSSTSSIIHGLFLCSNRIEYGTLKVY